MLIIRNLLLLLALILIFFNFYHQIPAYLRAKESLKSQPAVLGQEFLPLRPYVTNASFAGYINCRESSHPLTDPNIMGPYQVATTVLSPLILDYYHPYDHRYVLLQCPSDEIASKIQEQLKAMVVAQTKEGIRWLDRGAHQ
jgi:hypothetical protein